MTELDDDVFTSLVKQRYGAMFSSAYGRSGNRQDAEDAVQEAFLAAWRHADNIKSDNNPSGLLNTIAANKATDGYRRRKRQLPHGIAAIEEDGGSAAYSLPDPDPAINPQLRFDNNNIHPTICGALERLRIENPERAEAFLLYVIGQQSNQEIAKIQAVTPSTVRGRIHRARNALRRLLSPPNFDANSS